MTSANRAFAWAAAVAVTLALVLLVPYRLTDGDSCTYAAMGHDMARGGSWAAPTWDFHGAVACFHEHPPGAFWVSALLERLGAPAANAALAANALWTFAAVGGVVALARLFVSDPAAHLAGAAFLLHIAVLKYVQRGALEVPLAAAATWSVAAGLRLARSRWWTVATAVALAAAFLVRGIFGLVPAALLVLALADRALRPPLFRLLAAFLGTALALLAFDHAHAAATGHGFWSAYLERQVLRSLHPGGTPHSVEGETWPYYVGRALAYSLPWSLFPLARLLRGPRPLPSPAAWRLALAWIGLTVLGASLSSRAGSRYIFQIYAATSLLAGLAVGGWLPRRAGSIASVAVIALVPCEVLVKTVLHDRSEWWTTADLCETLRGDPRIAAREIRGPFAPEDDQRKALLRFHLDAWISSAPLDDWHGLQWVPGSRPDLPLGEVILVTPLGSLVDVR